MKLGNKLWGILFLLLAAFVVLGQLGILIPFDFWTIVSAGMAVILLINCITNRSISTLPFVIAMVYLVLRNQEMVEHVSTWAVFLAAGLMSCGLGFLFPQRPPRGNVVVGSFFGDCDWDEDEVASKRERAGEIGMDNNPSINVNFGSASRYLHADELETVRLSCNFGGMEIFFDQAKLSTSGATVYLDCKFGGIDLYVPRHWRVEEQIGCVFGGVDRCRHDDITADSPTLTIKGNVMFGGVDITYI